MVETTHDPDDEVLPPLADKWIQLRKSLSLVGDPIVLLGEGLPLRARRVLYDHSVTTVQQLLALDPQEIIANTNVGWASVAALLAKAAASMEATSGASETPDFVQLVDVVLDALPTLARDVVIGRFEEHTRSAELGRRLNISRERVRQIEEKFVHRVRRGSVGHNLLTQSVLDDELIDFNELTIGRLEPIHTRGFYVSVARAVLGSGDSYVDVERFYKLQLETVVKALRNRDDFLSASFLTCDIERVVREFAPALAEIPWPDVQSRVVAGLRARELGGRLIGPKPQVGRIIRALLRCAGATCSLDYLVSRLATVLAAYGEVSYFDVIKLRGKLAMMPDVHLMDEQTATLELPDDATVQGWQNRVVETICEADKPYSIVRFLDEAQDAPFDEYGLASLLRRDNYYFMGGRTAQYRQVGNAVPPLLGRNLARMVHQVVLTLPITSELGAVS